jgi:hypothetical protein
LERAPGDKLTWKPHEKSLTAGQLALHIAQEPSSVARLVQQNPAQAPDIGRLTTQPIRVQEVLKVLDDSTATVRNELAKFDDHAMQELWRLKHGDRELFAWRRRSSCATSC